MIAQENQSERLTFTEIVTRQAAELVRRLEALESEELDERWSIRPKNQPERVLRVSQAGLYTRTRGGTYAMGRAAMGRLTVIGSLQLGDVVGGLDA